MALNQVSPGCVLCVCVCNYTSNANSLMKKIDVQKEIKFTYNHTLVNILVGLESRLTRNGIMCHKQFCNRILPTLSKTSTIH